MLKKSLIYGGIALVVIVVIPVLIKNYSLLKKEDTDSEPQTKIQCKALTTSGNRCKRQSLPGNEYCWQHQS